MPRSEFLLSEYRGMWLFALFDLPVDTRAARHRYAQFRRLLIQEGFCMLQFSVYARYCASEDLADPICRRIAHEVPEDGHVRLLMVTDRQFGKMQVYHGKTRISAESVPAQLLLF